MSRPPVGSASFSGYGWGYLMDPSKLEIIMESYWTALSGFPRATPNYHGQPFCQFYSVLRTIPAPARRARASQTALSGRKTGATLGGFLRARGPEKRKVVLFTGDRTKSSTSFLVFHPPSSLSTPRHIWNRKASKGYDPSNCCFSNFSDVDNFFLSYPGRHFIDSAFSPSRTSLSRRGVIVFFLGHKCVLLGPGRHTGR